MSWWFRCQNWQFGYLVKVFKNAQSKICGRQPLKNLVYLARPYHFKFLKAAFHKLYLVHSWIPWPICSLKMTTTSKLRERIFVNWKTSFIITGERLFLTLQASITRYTYMSFAYCEGAIPLQKSSEVWFRSHRKLFLNLVLMICYFYCSKFYCGTSILKGND